MPPPPSVFTQVVAALLNLLLFAGLVRFLRRAAARLRDALHTPSRRIPPDDPGDPDDADDALPPPPRDPSPAVARDPETARELARLRADLHEHAAMLRPELAALDGRDRFVDEAVRLLGEALDAAPPAADPREDLPVLLRAFSGALDLYDARHAGEDDHRDGWGVFRRFGERLLELARRAGVAPDDLPFLFRDRFETADLVHRSGAEVVNRPVFAWRVFRHGGREVARLYLRNRGEPERCARFVLERSPEEARALSAAPEALLPPDDGEWHLGVDASGADGAREASLDLLLDGEDVSLTRVDGDKAWSALCVPLDRFLAALRAARMFDETAPADGGETGAA